MQPGELLEGLAGPGRIVRRIAFIGRTWWGMRDAPADRGAASVKLQRVAARICAENGIVVVDRRGPLPPPGCVVVANHISYVDTLVLPSLMPCTCIAKQQVADWPVIGPLTARLGVLFVDRDSPHSGAVVLRRAMRALEAGVTVVAFPEGTTTSGAELLPFRRGVFGLARRLRVPVVAAAISYDDPRAAWTGNTSFLGHYVRSVARWRRTAVRLSLSAPFDPRAHSDARGLAEAVREHITRELSLPGQQPARPRPQPRRYAAPSGRTTSLPTPSS